jgi:N-acetylneuraminic acid mutarotase
MKKITTACALFLIIASFVNAQSPQAFQYQAVLRFDDGIPVVNAEVSLKISILSDTIQNIVQYSEIQTTATNNYGMISLQIGKGNVLYGNFQEVQWNSGEYFIRIEFDETGGNTYQMAGQAQLLSVPYALFAENSGDALTAGEGISIIGNTINNTGDLSNTNELQTITKLGTSIILSKGGGSVTDSDNQTLTVNSAGTIKQIQISGGNTISIDVADNDNDPTNELQILSISNDTLFLSNGGFVKLPTPTNAIIPPGGCIQSLNPEPPAGYQYSGAGFSAGDQWYELPSMSYSRFGPAVASVNNKIYVFGGWDGLGAVSNVVEVYDIQTQTWDRKANMNTAVVYAAAAVVGNSIHVLGGYNGSSILNRHQVYNTLTNTWSVSVNLPQARSGGSATVVSGRIYLIGGYYNNSPVNSNFMFDPATTTWTSKSSMPTARTDFAIAQAYNGIYVIGGWNEIALNTHEYYDPANDTWTTLFPANYARAGCSAGVVNNKIYVIGGGDQYSYNSKTEEYDPFTNEWTSTASIPLPRSYFGAASIGQYIFVVGGNFGLALKSALRYDPTLTQFYIHCSE